MNQCSHCGWKEGDPQKTTMDPCIRCPVCRRARKISEWPCKVCGKTGIEGRHATDFGEGHGYDPKEYL